jgi:hypothetical protein
MMIDQKQIFWESVYRSSNFGSSSKPLALHIVKTLNDSLIMAPLYKLGALSIFSFSCTTAVTNAFSIFSDDFSGMSGTYSSDDFSGMSGGYDEYSDMMSADYSEIMSDQYSSRMSGDDYSNIMSADYSEIMSDQYSSRMSGDDYSNMMSTDDFSGMSGSYSSNDFSGMSGEYSDMMSADYSEIMSDQYSSRMSGDDYSEYLISGDLSLSFDFTISPTHKPSKNPTIRPTAAPSTAPTVSPTTAPTIAGVTNAPTSNPTAAPTAAPSTAPTDSPTAAPIVAPTSNPTTAPTVAPSTAPTAAPTAMPSATPTTRSPTVAPTSVPTSIYDTLEPSERTTSCYSDCSYNGMTVEPANWGEAEYCAFYASTGCTEESVAADTCMPSCLSDCVDVFCDSMSTLVYACDSSSDATYANKTRLENQCLNSNAATAETETLMTFDSSNTFDGVSADEMRNDQASQDAAIAAMSLAMSGIPANQITIKSITDSTRRNLQGNVQRRLAGGVTVVYSILANLEALGYSSTDSSAAYNSLTGQISNSVSSGAFQQNLKAAGQSKGVSTFAAATVSKPPAFSEPTTVAVKTVAPTSAPTMAPTSTKKRNGGGDDDEELSSGITAAIVICTIIGCCCIVIVGFFALNKKKREDLEEQFKQHNFLSRSSSKDVSKKSASGGPSVKSFDSIDEQYGVRGKKGADPYGMDVELENKRKSDLDSRRMSEEVRPSRKSDI